MVIFLLEQPLKIKNSSKTIILDDNKYDIFILYY
jgi:hypothetical protein